MTLSTWASRAVIAATALAVGFAAASLLPGRGRQEAKAPTAPAVVSEGTLKLDDGQIKTAGIEVTAAASGTIARRIAVPGTIVPSSDRVARVAVKLSATVLELRKKPGDMVSKGEVLAILESREVADAKSDYLAARLTSELDQELFERDRILWDKRVASEQQFLRSRNLAAQARMRLDTARQKLFALGFDTDEIAALPRTPEALMRRQEVRSPIAGRVVERKVDQGAAVGRDSLETELFVIVDLDRVWADISVSPSDLPVVKEGQTVEIAARGIAQVAHGTLIFINPLLDRESRSARAMAEIANSDGRWRPGTFVTASIVIEEHAVAVAVPAASVQTIGAEKVVFVRTPEGFAKRPVVLGRADDRKVEIVEGLRPGESIAASNSFLLKAEMLKGPAED